MAKIVIDGIEMEFSANAATPIRYKQIFGRDLLREAQDTENSDYYEMITQLAYVLNRQGNKIGFKDTTFGDYVEWLEKFSPMAFIDVADDIIGVWTDSEKTNSKPKK